MGLLDLLTREHDVFRALLERMETAFKYGEEIARREIQENLLLLVPALEKHERIEDVAFPVPERGSRADHRRAVAQMAEQHEDVSRLRARALEALEHFDRVSIEELKTLVLRLGDRLRVHFRMEERRLWPEARPALGRAREAAMERRLSRQLRDLERSIERGRAAIGDYLGGRR